MVIKRNRIDRSQQKLFLILFLLVFAPCPTFRPLHSSPICFDFTSSRLLSLHFSASVVSSSARRHSHYVDSCCPKAALTPARLSLSRHSLAACRICATALIQILNLHHRTRRRARKEGKMRNETDENRLRAANSFLTLFSS